MSPYSIIREHAVADAMAVQEAINLFVAQGKTDGAVVARLLDLRDSIEEQVEKIDPVEALVQEFTHEADSDAAEFWTTVQWRKHHDRFAASLAEVLRIGAGNERPALMEKVQAQHADFLMRAAWARKNGKRKAAAIWTSAADLLQYLLPETGDGQPSAFDLANMADESARLDAANADGDAYRQGVGDTIATLHLRLTQLRSSAITAERQDAFDKAIEAVEAMG